MYIMLLQLCGIDERLRLVIVVAKIVWIGADFCCCSRKFRNCISFQPVIVR